ncbi:MAG: LysM peptidoglycan-binding domain-containing protein [Actinomycetota bacterium]|nr:LysM peptidoglycan-binding domain-containing protein [Actinomycetota bacterium]
MRFRILGAIGALALFAPAAASAAFPHVVAPGESLYSVAAADGLSVDQLAAANGVSPDTQLVAGSTLQIPPQSSAVAGSGVGVSSTPMSTTAGSATVGDGDADSDDPGATSTASAASTGTSTTVSTGTGGYLVQPGDTLWAIATRSGVSVDALASANGLDPNGLLLSGASISIPGASASAPTLVSTTPSSTAPAVASGQSGPPPYPTPERVTASEVGSIGSANGVAPSLADAIGWQESGFNNDLTSSAGAVGVMQIMPGTWDWIQRTLTAGAPLNPASAADNVRAGSLYLHQLLGSTGGSPSLAAAGYYQGLASVRAHGMYSDTQNYVNSVLSLKQRFGGG